MICWVVERALAAKNVSRVIVATDNQRIAEAVASAGHAAIITAREHASGTDRIAEVAESLDAGIIVNLQGDEPLISPKTIDLAIDAMAADREVGIVTTWEAIESASDVLNPGVVKLVTGLNGEVIYFSRLPIPYPRELVREFGSLDNALQRNPALVGKFRKHTGLYVFRRETLLKFASWPQSTLERSENLEQLRALEHGVKIKAVEACTPSIGVDTQEDLEKVRAIVESQASLLQV